MTGKHSHKNGFMNNGNSFNWNPQTFPKLLRKQGSTGSHTSRASRRDLMTGRFFRFRVE